MRAVIARLGRSIASVLVTYALILHVLGPAALAPVDAGNASGDLVLCLDHDSASGTLPNGGSDGHSPQCLMLCAAMASAFVGGEGDPIRLPVRLAVADATGFAPVPAGAIVGAASDWPFSPRAPPLTA
ncbi:hypothetical protein [Oryzibacter oryziterrae]|uniref:hypothetical protein n=1 Tax=Oryzibacter oryziterrae TaxID=2766474 RepID=UPI001F24CA08|nr:hypothetical protein [Oryzibacter oryziterrae]